MTKTQRLLTYTALVYALSVSAAFGQLQAPTRLDVVERVAASCPGLIANDHAFTDAVASELYRQDQRWGRNGKRGNPNDLSHDAIAYRNPNSPFGVSIVDIIGGAGGPNPQPAWIDQTQATIDGRTTGVWVAPTGRSLPCLTGGGGAPTPVNPTPVTPAPSVDLGPVLAKLAAIEARLSAIEARPQAEPVDLSGIDGYIDDMIGKGPADDPDTPNHVTDIKERLDKERALLEQILQHVQRMAGARIFRF